MSLQIEVTATIKEYKITLDKPLTLHVNDSLDLKLTLKKWGITNPNSFQAPDPVIFELEGLQPKMYVENSLGRDTVEATSVENNVITFPITHMHTRYPGRGRMQVVLVDAFGKRLALPEFPYDVKATINEEQDMPLPSTLIYAVATNDHQILLTDDGKYIEYGREVFE